MNSAAQIEAFLEMMSAERGAADNTLAIYRRDLEDAASSHRRRPGRRGRQPTSAPISAASRRRASPPPRRRASCRRCGSSSSSSMPRACAPTTRPARSTARGEAGRCPRRWRGRDRPAARPRGTAKRPTRPRGRRPRGSDAPARAGRGALCHRPARFRAGRPAGDGGACATSASSSCAARATRSAWCRCRTRRATRCAPGSPSARRVPALADSPLSVSRRLRQRPSAAPGLCPRPEGARRARRHRGGEDLAACAAPCLRQPSAAERRRPARRAATARPCRHLDHADLHPCAGGAAGALVNDHHPLAD